MVDPAWVALSLIDRVGAKTLRALIARFGDSGAVLRADADALRQVRGIGPKIAAAIGAVDLAAVEAALPRWQAAGVRLLTLDDPAYPAQLRAVEDAPATLFVRGDWRVISVPAVAIVGTRQPSAEAAQAAEKIAAELAGRGCLIVSGLALGIDTQAHIGAIGARGQTLAVLGSGVLRVYPERNQNLAETIIRYGAVASEVAPTAPPSPPTLVARNRIISGLCVRLIVIETGIDGGAMHAARRAFEQGRAVYALDLDASGNRALIEQGAQPIGLSLNEISQFT